MAIKMTREAPGYYSYTSPDGLTWHVGQIRDADPGSGAQGKWFYEGGDGEGGNDHYYTMAEAVACLEDYIAHRQWVPPYGWCYVPGEV